MAQAVDEVQNDITAKVIEKLRVDPETACESWSYKVSPKNDFNIQYGSLEGKQCCVVAELPVGDAKDNKGVYQLTVQNGNGDWYIPFVARKAAYCDVPIKPQKGTLVVTPGMNGCALRIYRLNDHFRFYHDADGKNMPANPPGDPVRSIEYDDYAGDQNIGVIKSTASMRTLTGLDDEPADDATQNNKKNKKNKKDKKNKKGINQANAMFSYALISVFDGDRWSVFAPGEMTTIVIDSTGGIANIKQRHLYEKLEDIGIMATFK